MKSQNRCPGGLGKGGLRGRGGNWLEVEGGPGALRTGRTCLTRSAGSGRESREQRRERRETGGKARAARPPPWWAGQGQEAAAGGYVGELSGKGDGQAGDRRWGEELEWVTRASGESGWRLGRASPALTPPLTQHPGSTAPVLTLPGPLGLPSSLTALLCVHWPGPALASGGPRGGQQA